MTQRNIRKVKNVSQAMGWAHHYQLTNLPRHAMSANTNSKFFSRERGLFEKLLVLPVANNLGLNPGCPKSRRYEGERGDRNIHNYGIPWDEGRGAKLNPGGIAYCVWWIRKHWTILYCTAIAVYVWTTCTRVYSTLLYFTLQMLMLMLTHHARCTMQSMYDD